MYTLNMLIAEAYDVPRYRVVGRAHWMDTDMYNIEAKPSANSDLSEWIPKSFKSPMNPEMRLMLRTLLADRFHLSVRREAKLDSIYVLVASKGGPKLDKPAPAYTVVSADPNILGFDCERSAAPRISL